MNRIAPPSRRLTRALFPAFAALTLVAMAPTAQAAAQRLLVPDSDQRVIMEFDPETGALVDSVAIDLAALTAGAARTPIEVLEAPNGEIWVSDQVADTIFRISGDGSTLLGTVGAPLDNCRGLAPSAQGALVANSGATGGAPGDSLVELDGAGAFLGAASIGDPYDVEPYVFNGVPGFLVSDILGEDLVFVDAADYSNQSVFHGSNGISGIDTPQQIHVSSTGRVFAAGSSTPVGLFEYGSAGQEIQYIDTATIAGLGGVRGVFLLGSGNLLFTTGSGVHIYHVATQTITTEIDDVSGRLISLYVGAQCVCSGYCAANPNSTGAPGLISGAGSSFAADNDLTLTASSLPANSFGFFITSRAQGFVANPAGSAGNLCLSGAIGRYVGPGQIQNAGPTGTFSYALDLTQTPQPLGLTAVMPGDTWNYQAWFRDSMGGLPTSNFTNGLSADFQ